MAVQLRFNPQRQPIPPTIVLANRSCDKIGQIPAVNITYKESMHQDEMSFKVYKIDSNGSVTTPYWDQIRTFKTVWCKEWNEWMSITVDIDEDIDTVKNITATSLGEAELSQINLYGIGINSETDISRDDYKITVIYDSDNPKASLLNRITEKAPLYTIHHVDASLAKMQRTFEFDQVSLYDALQQIAEELNCLVVIDSSSGENGKPKRWISLYDLEQKCNSCGYRGEFTDKCPKCGSTDFTTGYGEDTTIFVSSEKLGTNMALTSDTDSVKNCFKLIGGDDLMSATIRNCSPSGTDYIYHFSDEDKEDMSAELSKKLDQYDVDYDYYMNKFQIPIDNQLISNYNSLIKKYKSYNKELEEIKSPIIGYQNLMLALYGDIDFLLYLQSGMMPSIEIQETTAKKEAAKLTPTALSPVSVQDVSKVSTATAGSAVLAMAKILVDSRYRVKINNSNLQSQTWTGNFTITNYSDEEDTTISATISVQLDDDYERYTKQKIEKILNKEDDSNLYSISGLFKANLSTFKTEIKKYCLNSLNSFCDACQSCIDILIEQGIGDKDTWSANDPNLYDDMYVPYLNKMRAIEAEIITRENEIKILDTFNDTLNAKRTEIQKNLDMETYFGTNLWQDLLVYRREDVYENENFISDNLNNSELFQRAMEFVETATKEIYKSSTLQKSISTTLNNLLVMKEFEPILDYFKIGNWIRVRIDGQVYRLRLVDYEVNFDDLNNLSVTFSDVTKIKYGYSDTASILEKASSMSTSYSSVKRQASSGKYSKETITDWISNGLDITNVNIVSGADNQTQSWDSHGILLRKKDDITGGYSDSQMRILNSSLVVTTDNWETVKTAVGEYIYKDPETGELISTYGINGETLIGRLLLGKKLGLYNENSSIEIDDAITITTQSNEKVDLFLIRKKYTDSMGNTTYSKQFYIDSEGNLTLGNGAKILWDGVDNPFALENVVENDIVALNNNIKTIASQITDLSSHIKRTDENMESLSTTVSSFDSRITKNTSNISTLSEQVSGIQKNIQSISSDVSSLSKQVKTNTTNITNLQTEFKKLSERVQALENA